MKVAVISLVLLGLLAAVSASVLIATLTGRPANASSVSSKEELETQVLVATRDLAANSLVDATAVKISKIPKAQVPLNALLNPVQVVGKIISEPMVAEQAFTKSCFAREGAGVYLATAITPGKRAMSVSLTDWSGMAGLLYPGSVVDVLVSFKSLGDNRRNETEMMATTLLQGLEVLAIGSQSVANDEYHDRETGALAQRGQMNYRMVTLLVDTKQAEILQLAMQTGSISLSMRNPTDVSHEARRLTRAREIAPNRGPFAVTSSEENSTFADEPPQPPPVAPPATKPAATLEEKLWETLIVRGAVTEKRTFPMPKDRENQDEEAAPSVPAGDSSLRGS